MNRKISVGVSIALMAIAAAITFTITFVFTMNTFNSMVYNLNEREAMYKKIAEIDGIVREGYLGVIDEEKLLDNISSGYMAGIGDAYSGYISAENYERLQTSLSGYTIGIGVQYQKDSVSGYLKVVDVRADSPAEVGGIEVDDLIIKIDGADVALLSADDAQRALSGEIGSSLVITIRRGSEEEDIELLRKRIENQFVFSKIVGENAIVRITYFNEVAYAQFVRVITDLSAAGVKGIAFDLRGNPGGVIESAAQMLDRILPAGDLMSSTNKVGVTEVQYRSNDNCLENIYIAVLINKNTASAAELFAAAIRDYNYGKLVGTATYGKGVMQVFQRLSDGSAIEMTTSYFNPPSGVNFNGVGVKPDYEETLTDEQEKNIKNMDEVNDPQIKKALEVIEAQKKNVRTAA